jgi:hypothetical protein
MQTKQISNRYLGTSLEQQRKSMANRSFNRFDGDATIFDTSLVGDSLSFDIVSTATTKKTLVLFPGAAKTVAEILSLTGLTVDGIIGVTNVDLIAVSAENLAFFQRFVERNPLNIPEIQIQVSNASQLNNPIKVCGLSPVGRGKTKPISPRSYQRPSDGNETLVTMQNLPLQLDDQTAIIYDINPGTTVTFNLFIGAARNAAAIHAELSKAYLYNV